MKSFLAAAMLWLAAVTPVTAYAQQHAPNTFSEFGAGPLACGDWKMDGDFQVAQWIVGFWSGINFAGPVYFSHVGADMTTKVIIAEVRATCRTDPTQTISSATMAVYLRHMKAEMGKGT